MATRRTQAPRGAAAAGTVSAAGPEWRRRLLLGLAAVAGLVAVYLIAATLVPRWWAQRIGDAVGGHLWVGIVLGITISLVCTLFAAVAAALRGTPRAVARSPGHRDAGRAPAGGTQPVYPRRRRRPRRRGPRGPHRDGRQNADVPRRDAGRSNRRCGAVRGTPVADVHTPPGYGCEPPPGPQHLKGRRTMNHDDVVRWGAGR